MHLFDRVARVRAPMQVALRTDPTTPFEVTGASAFASQVERCPLRFVLGDDLTRASAELAFADGARLAGCLDLLRMPATSLWIEWNDEVHKRVIWETQSSADYDAEATGRRVGVLLRGSVDGCTALARTFWLDANAADDAEPVLSPVETHIDLNGHLPPGAPIDGILAGGFARVTDGPGEAMTHLLDHVRFRIDDSWAAYYRAAAPSAALRQAVINASLGSVARDPPLLLAFFLLLSAKNAVRSLPVSRAAINHKRAARGRAPLLDHIEVRASLDLCSSADAGGVDRMNRRGPRLHHVRGHLVRRNSRVFWRVPHLRGSAARGAVRSRTVCLSFGQRQEQNAGMRL